MGLPTKLLADGETPLVVLRPHVRRLLRPALVLLVLTPAAAYAEGAVPAGSGRATIRAIVAGVVALVALRWVVAPFVLWWNTRYVLTDERLFERAGVLRRTGHDLPLRGVTDVVVAQRLGERLLGSGTLSVTTDGGADFTVTDVPAVTRLQRSLLAVADDVTERSTRPARPRARPGGPDEERDADAFGHPFTDPFPDPSADDDGHGGYHEPDRDPYGGPTGYGDGDHDRDDDGPDRREVRRRERDSARRLRELQAQVRRGPLPDSPLEDDAAPDVAPAATPGRPAASDRNDPPDPPDPPDGARILRFPRRS